MRLAQHDGVLLVVVGKGQPNPFGHGVRLAAAASAHHEDFGILARRQVSASLFANYEYGYFVPDFIERLLPQTLVGEFVLLGLDFDELLFRHQSPPAADCSATGLAVES